jgi:hypothetical protein
MSRDPSRQQPVAPSAWRRAIEKLGPYQSLALMLVPLSVVEPLKLVAVAVAGEGHWLTGTGMIIVAYAASIFLVERLFEIVKPKLLTLGWFAWLWTWFVALRGRIALFFTSVFAPCLQPPADRP